MFNRRLTVFLVIVLVVGAVYTLRLVQLQVVRADQYAEAARKSTKRPVRYIPAVRGKILDRHNNLLASDEPSWDICMHYRAMAADESHAKWTAVKWRRRNLLPEFPELEKYEQKRRHEEIIARKIEDSYALVAELSAEPLGHVRRNRDYTLTRVATLQRFLSKRVGYAREPMETRMYHPLARGLTDQAAVKAKMALAEFDWLTVRASTRRVYHDATAMGHLMGRLGRVTQEACRNDPHRGKDLLEYKGWEMFGVAGVERLCEQMLRGRRGKIEMDIDGREMGRDLPVDGPDVRLTIDGDLQKHIYDMLGKAVREHELSSGGAAVVLHIPTRQILAIASYPSYDPNLFRKNYAKLRDDTRRRPTLFRAVAGVYPPGSVVKPATLTTGLALNVITPESRLSCPGYLHSPTGRFKCWIFSKYSIGHNQQFPGGPRAEEALQVSCNCFFYRLGEMIHGDRLCQWFRQFWVGPPPPPNTYAGTGLVEEREGILPTAAWLWKHQRRPMRPGDSRNYAIGQGELGLTPLQVANLMATIASGEFRWPTLVANDGRNRPTWDLGIKPEHWQTVRNGLFRVVNHPKGTAYKYARMDEVLLSGKTGSAQCSRIVLDRRFVVEWPDGRRGKLVAKTEGQLRERLADSPGAKIISSRPYHLWPPKRTRSGRKVNATHAWFAGFLPTGPGVTPEIAIAVLVEFGESGGRAAAPVTQDIIRALIASPHGYVKSKKPTPPI